MKSVSGSNFEGERFGVLYATCELLKTTSETNGVVCVGKLHLNETKKQPKKQRQRFHTDEHSQVINIHGSLHVGFGSRVGFVTIFPFPLIICVRAFLFL